MLVDSHCHLNFPDFADDLDAVVGRAKAAGVEVMQTICTHMAEFPEILAIAERFPAVYCSVGVHPNNVGKAELVTVAELVNAAEHLKVIGLGETGLDYHYTPELKEKQQESFRRHIEASRQTDLPVIIHTRDADEDTVEILKVEKQKGDFKALIHCFSSSRYLAEESVKLGLSISLSGILTFKNAREIQEVAATLSPMKVLVETDAPYLAPVPYRGKRNEPAYTADTNRFLAQLMGIDEQQMAHHTTTNFFELFSRAKAA